MRHSHSSITPHVIHQRAQHALRRCLPWRAYQESVSVDALLNLLLLMAATVAALSAVVKRFFAFSHETARQAVKANLPSRERLVAGLVDALHDVLQLSRLDCRRRWNVAIDTHYVPYYGQPTPDVVGGPKKHGTQWFFGYASAVLLHQHRRYMVAFGPLHPQQSMHEIVRELLDQIAGKGLKIRGVALDSAFDSGDTLLLLQERQLAYVVPLRRKGTGDNARNRCFEGRHHLVRWTEWYTDQTRRLVRTRVLLWKGSRRTMAFAFGGWSGPRGKNIYEQAKQQRQLYRRRFGIETSYRQKNQAKAPTTSLDPVYRLLLEGVAYLLRQVWVILTEELARGRHAKPDEWIGELTMQILLDWLKDDIAEHAHENRSIPLNAKTSAV